MQQQAYQYIIIGAGVAGLQAARILAQNQQDFIILEASDIIGGRIATDTLGEIIKNKQKQGQDVSWLSSNEEIMDAKIDYGATWISTEHTYLLSLLKKYQIKAFPQYADGLTIYGIDLDRYQKLQSLKQHYKYLKKDITKLLNKIESIKDSFQTLLEQKQQNTTRRRKYSSEQQINNNINYLKGYNILRQYIDFYDKLTVADFIKKQIKSQYLAYHIIHQIQLLQCISCDQFTMIQLIHDDGSLQVLKFFCDHIQNTPQGLRVKGGMIAVIQAMANDIIDLLTENCDKQVCLEHFIKFNSPVYRIQNQIGQNVKVYVKNSNKVYTGSRVLFSVPIAVANKIQITKISPSKKLIFENQQPGTVHRLYLIFQTAFWRGKFNGNGSFSFVFPFGEVYDISPSNLACGALVFTFIGDKYNKWKSQNPTNQQQKAYFRIIIAKMFLNGNQKSKYVQNFILYVRTFTSKPYIRGAYQSTTKPNVCRMIQDNNDDFWEAYKRDQYNIFYIGSQFTDQHVTYVEGGLRNASSKVHKLLGKKDPFL